MEIRLVETDDYFYLFLDQVESASGHSFGATDLETTLEALGYVLTKEYINDSDAFENRVAELRNA